MHQKVCNFMRQAELALIIAIFLSNTVVGEEGYNGDVGWPATPSSQPITEQPKPLLYKEQPTQQLEKVGGADHVDAVQQMSTNSASPAARSNLNQNTRDFMQFNTEIMERVMSGNYDLSGMTHLYGIVWDAITGSPTKKPQDNSQGQATNAAHQVQQIPIQGSINPQGNELSAANIQPAPASSQKSPSTGQVVKLDSTSIPPVPKTKADLTSNDQTGNLPPAGNSVSHPAIQASTEMGRDKNGLGNTNSIRYDDTRLPLGQKSADIATGSTEAYNAPNQTPAVSSTLPSVIRKETSQGKGKPASEDDRIYEQSRKPTSVSGHGQTKLPANVKGTTPDRNVEPTPAQKQPEDPSLPARDPDHEWPHNHDTPDPQTPNSNQVMPPAQRYVILSIYASIILTILLTSFVVWKGRKSNDDKNHVAVSNPYGGRNQK